MTEGEKRKFHHQEKTDRSKRLSYVDAIIDDDTDERLIQTIGASEVVEAMLRDV